jgi:hypothetical protein
MGSDSGEMAVCSLLGDHTAATMSLERVDSVDPVEVYDYIVCG